MPRLWTKASKAMTGGDRDPFVVPVNQSRPEAASRASGAGPGHGSHSDGAPASGPGTTPPAPPAAVDAAAAYAVAAEAGDAVAGERLEADAGSVAESGAAESSADAETLEGEAPVAPQVDDLAVQTERANTYLALAQRTQADFENFRKRAVRDAGLAQERGIVKLAKELLPAIDNLDRAVQAAATWGSSASATAEVPGEDTAAAHEAQLSAGLKLVHDEVLAALARVGIEAFSPAGELFDPQCQEAVAQTPIEGAASGTVVEVYQQGYRLGETVLRPARVLVAA